jgi:hypothetical protein
MIFEILTADGNRFLETTKSNIFETDQRQPFHLKEKIDICPYIIYLIGCGDLINSKSSLHEDIKSISPVHAAWQYLNRNPSGISQGLQQELDVIYKIGNRISNQHKEIGVRFFQLKGNPNNNTFFYLIKENDNLGIPVHLLRTLCNVWQVRNGHFPLHASGVIHNRGLYLFSGPSGSGKSTIAKLSLQRGDKYLDEDQVMVYPLEGTERYSADAWGYSLTSNEIPIRAFFRLIQSQDDSLFPLSRRLMVKYIWEQSLEISSIQFPENELRSLFKQIIEFSRKIPGYELNFRKSPDFWQLIDSEIPCE